MYEEGEKSSSVFSKVEDHFLVFLGSGIMWKLVEVVEIDWV